MPGFNGAVRSSGGTPPLLRRQYGLGLAAAIRHWRASDPRSLSRDAGQGGGVADRSFPRQTPTLSDRRPLSGWLSRRGPGLSATGAEEIDPRRSPRELCRPRQSVAMIRATVQNGDGAIDLLQCNESASRCGTSGATVLKIVGAAPQPFVRPSGPPMHQGNAGALCASPARV